MSLDFSHQILASIWEEQIISAHHFCYQYLPQSFLWCFSSLWRREERNPILWASACQLCFWTDALFMCLWQRVVSLMCRNEPGELWGCCWRWDTLCPAVQWFVLVAAAVPILLCKMQYHQVGTVKASCFHLFFGLQILSSLHAHGIYQLLLENLNELKKSCPISLQIILGKQIQKHRTIEWKGP